jgi:hypothetical protein
VTRRRLLRLGLALLAVAIGVALFLLATGGYERQGLAWVTGRAAVPVPSWTRPCWRPGELRRGRRSYYTLPCARVEGRVVYRENRDPDGDGDAHYVVAGGGRLVVVKVPARAAVRELPGLGDRVTAVGTQGDGPLLATGINLQPPRRDDVPRDVRQKDGAPQDVPSAR